FAVRSITGTIAFVNPVATHGSPFVMVTVEPNLCKIFKDLVLRNFIGWKVAMIINDRHLFSELMVEHLRRIGLQQKIFVHESFYSTGRLSGTVYVAHDGVEKLVRVIKLLVLFAKCWI